MGLYHKMDGSNWIQMTIVIIGGLIGGFGIRPIWDQFKKDVEEKAGKGGSD